MSQGLEPSFRHISFTFSRLIVLVTFRLTMAGFPFSLRCSALIVMVAALLVAIAFVVAHDAFSRSLKY
jgi:fatty acid desaturase